MTTPLKVSDLEKTFIIHLRGGLMLPVMRGRWAHH